jgi:hypothetical protein
MPVHHEAIMRERIRPDSQPGPRRRNRKLARSRRKTPKYRADSSRAIALRRAGAIFQCLTPARGVDNTR